MEEEGPDVIATRAMINDDRNGFSVNSRVIGDDGVARDVQYQGTIVDGVATVTSVTGMVNGVPTTQQLGDNSFTVPLADLEAAASPDAATRNPALARLSDDLTTGMEGKPRVVENIERFATTSAALPASAPPPRHSRGENHTPAAAGAGTGQGAGQGM